MAVRHRQVHLRAHGKESCVDSGIAGLMASLWAVCDTRSCCEDEGGRAYLVATQETEREARNLLAMLGLNPRTENGGLSFQVPEPAWLHDAAAVRLAVEQRTAARNALRARWRTARARWEHGDAGGAHAELEAVLAEQLQLLGPDHSDVLVTRNDAAAARVEMGRAVGMEETLADQVRILEEGVTALTRFLGADHANVLTARANLAAARARAGDLEAAIPELEGVLVDLERVLGPDHENTLASRNNLASFRGQAGVGAGAAAELAEIVAAQSRIHGADHPQTLLARANHAMMLGEAGELDAAVAELAATFADQVRVLGPEHPRTLQSRANLAHLRGEAGRDARIAVEELAALLVDQRRVLGLHHPNTLLTMSNLAAWYLEFPRPDEAVAALRHLLDEAVRTLGADHPTTDDVRETLVDLRDQHWDASMP